MKDAIKFFWLFIVLLQMAQSYAVIINMEEFYNPSLQQTVILMGDLHATASEVDELQYNALFNAVKKYKAHVIIEGSPDNCWWGSLKVLPRFAYMCWVARIPLSNIEFRKHVDNLMYLAEHANNCQKIDDIKTFFQTNVTRIDVFDSFIKMGIENSHVKKEIVDFISTLNALPQKNMFENELLFFMQDALKKYDQIVDEIKSLAPYQATCDESYKHKAVDAMINNFFFERDGHVYTLAGSAYDKSFNLQAFFLDLRVIKQMYAHRKERMVFVYTGQAHTRHISTILRAIGFELKFQISNDVEACGLIKDLHRRNDLDEAYKSEAMMQCYNNVEEFFGLCSTLPYYPEISNSSRIFKFFVGGSVVAAGTWLAYMLFSKMDKLSVAGASAAMGTVFKSTLFTSNQPFDSQDSESAKLEKSNKYFYAKTFLASSFLALSAFLVYGKFGPRDA